MVKHGESLGTRTVGQRKNLGTDIVEHGKAFSTDTVKYDKTLGTDIAFLVLSGVAHGYSQQVVPQTPVSTGFLQIRNYHIYPYTSQPFPFARLE